MLRRRVEATVEIEVLTFWVSMASVRRFAGDNTDRAVVEEEAKAVLTRFESRVRHFDFVLDALSRTNLPRETHLDAKGARRG